jgi:hypothetical protein
VPLVLSHKWLRQIKFESVVLNHNVVCTHNKSDRSCLENSAIAFSPFIKGTSIMTYTTHTQQAIPSSSRNEQKAVQTELYSYIEAEAQAVAPEELTIIEISFYDHEIYANDRLIAQITYDHNDFVTQPWLVMVNGTEEFRANTWTKCYRYICTHHKDGLLPVQEEETLIAPELDDCQQKILLPPTDPNAEVTEIPGYKLVYVNGACPRTYRVYKAHSMIGVIFQHITHWSNAVDQIRYAESLDAAVALDDFMKVALKPIRNSQLRFVTGI